MADILLLLAIPLTSSLIGWATNVLAVRMMFYPLQFIGKPPLLGWQGVVPANAAKMAEIAVDLMLNKLISVEEIFARVEPERMANMLNQNIAWKLEQIIDEVMLDRAPTLWEILPLWVKDEIYKEVRNDVPNIAAQMIGDVKDNIIELFDLRSMMIDALVHNRDLLNEMFLRGGDKEFKFIERSGLYFGFLFGILSMIVWIYYDKWWTLPLGGLLVGYATNWVAIKMIFEPREPKKIGPFVFRGRFFLRQREVAFIYAELVSERLLTAERILGAILHGPASDRFFVILQRHINRSIDAYTGIVKPYIIFGIGTDGYIELKHKICSKIMEQLPESIKYIEGYTEQALDIEDILRTKITAMTPDEFEGLLHPAFQQDEWKLITVGAVLGLGAGFWQLSFFY